jgi:serine/threonine-protein kinase
MANDAVQPPARPSKPTGSSPSERERRIREGSEPSVPSGGTYFLGRYRVVDEIGIGGMASVHLARADGPGGFQKWVAIKRIHRHLAEDETFIRMFLDEARIAARISHPNVAQVFDLGKHKDTYWIAMEYLHGEPLREIMRAVEEGGAPHMTAELAAKIVADAAEGLHAAHELRDKNGKLLNLVHRDVTPHNLFLTYDGAVKVVDFGIAKVAGRLSTTRAGTLKGKLAYMSPEQVRGVAIDRRTDIFALGVVLWELTTGRRLFRMDSDLETLERVQACVVPPPSSIVEGYPGELEIIVMRALAKDPEKRYPSSRDMSRALQQYLMRASSFIGSEEIGTYVKHVLSDRFQKREAHLQWAAEVTQTVSLDSLEAGSQLDAGDGSVLTFASDVQEVPRAPRPAAGAQVPVPPASRNPSAPSPQAPSVSRQQPFNSTLPLNTRAPSLPGTTSPPRPAAGAPAAPGLPRYEGSSQTNTEDLLEEEDDELVKTRVTDAPSLAMMDAAPPKATMLGLGPPKQSGPKASTGVMHDYGAEDEDIVTTVMSSPLEEQEVQTGSISISTVHEPAKSRRPAAMPDDAIVVAPTLLGAHEQMQHPGMTAPAHGGHAHQQHYATAQAYGAAQPAPSATDQQRSSVLIAVIAAATTLIALTLTALVVLKITEGPKEPEARAVSTQTNQPTLAPTQPIPGGPTPGITVVPVPATAPTAAPTMEGAVNPESLPKETKPAPAPVAAAGGGNPKPTPAPGPAPGGAPAPTPPTPGKGEPGFLTVMCVPACDSVTAGGRSLGPSPVVRAALPPGNHGVGLRAGAKKKSLSVTITSGQTTARRVTMD